MVSNSCWEATSWLFVNKLLCLVTMKQSATSLRFVSVRLFRAALSRAGSALLFILGSERHLFPWPRPGKMVCEDCEKKMGSRGVHQDVWKDGARNTFEGGGRKLNENTHLTKQKRRARALVVHLFTMCCYAWASCEAVCHPRPDMRTVSCCEAYCGRWMPTGTAKCTNCKQQVLNEPIRPCGTE